MRYRNSSHYDDGTRVRSIDATGVSGGALLDMGRLADAIKGRAPSPRLAGLIVERVNGTLNSTKLEAVLPHVLLALREKYAGGR